MTTKTPTKKTLPIKTIGLALLGLVGVSHIGLLGYVLRPQNQVHQPPTINIPHGPYSSYRIKAGKDGYEIEFRANDPKVLESERSLQLDEKRGGLFGGGDTKRREHRRDQYTMDGARNLGGASVDDEGKSLAKSEECIRADAGARSQGAMAGSAIAAGVAVPALVSIPYVGWLAGGWALLLGQKAGSEIGSEVGKVFNDC
ncbi:hypothetical protein R1080702_184 [Cyanophage S-RIM32]|uniref:Uncharacterized protein n=1 Tax=Cyanophage S-RIM32 TaxID=1278479 RepID=A0A127KM75_9CAUD|nr:hypothetical protein BJD26_gp072 [Cyanophage S-RIM32]AMO43193.1 hypothetical protein R1080702_184 [Cyanophage S-RIM32]